MEDGPEGCGEKFKFVQKAEGNIWIMSKWVHSTSGYYMTVICVCLPSQPVSFPGQEKGLLVHLSPCCLMYRLSLLFSGSVSDE